MCAGHKIFRRIDAYRRSRSKSKSRKKRKIFKRLPKSARKRDYEVRYGRTDSCAGDSGAMLPDIHIAPRREQKTNLPLPGLKPPLSAREELVTSALTTPPHRCVKERGEYLEDILRRFFGCWWSRHILANGFLSVRASWSLQLKLWNTNVVYFHISMKKRATLLRFLTH